MQTPVTTPSGRPLTATRRFDSRLGLRLAIIAGVTFLFIAALIATLPVHAARADASRHPYITGATGYVTVSLPLRRSLRFPPRSKEVGG